MKKMICELCEGSEFLKQDGLFVCQSCGCKYAPEEAKLLMKEIDEDPSSGVCTTFLSSVQMSESEESIDDIVVTEDDTSSVNEKLEERISMLQAKIQEINDQGIKEIDEVKKKLEERPEAIEIKELAESIKELENKKSSLGVFKGKEKKELQLKIDSLNHQKEMLKTRYDLAKNNANTKIKELEQRSSREIKRINEELKSMKIQDKKSNGNGYEIYLDSFNVSFIGNKTPEVLKVLREITGKTLPEAIELADNPPKIIKGMITKEETDSIVKRITDAGGDVEVKPRKKYIVIRNDKCVGCGMCTRVCPESCISSSGKTAPGHKLPSMEIDDSKCTYCGKCREACKFNAIMESFTFGEARIYKGKRNR